MRADRFLYFRGLARSRSHAASLIAGGVLFDGEPVKKPSQEIPEDADLSRILIQSPSKYVSRGGYKLEAALRRFRIDVAGKTALDLGASTGGFTDCLLQHRAIRVFAVDVGHDQLAASLRGDDRVIPLDGVNARYLTSEELGGTCIDLAVSDLSFISQRLIYPTILRTVRRGGEFISLIKPQFEAGREHLSKNGIVRDRSVHKSVIETLFRTAEENGLYPEALAPSPITGGDGNHEYLALFRVGEKRDNPPDILPQITSE